MEKIDFQKTGFATRLIHEKKEISPARNAIGTPIYLAATFGVDSIQQMDDIKDGKEQGFLYSRMGNPTTKVLEDKLAALEGGEAAICTASGMGAVGSVLIGLLQSGDHVVAADAVYGGTDYALRCNLPLFGIQVTFVDICNPAEVEAAITDKTKLIYFETPVNPNMRIADIKAIADIGKRRGVKVAVDSTFAPPPIQYPLQLGADIVIHSTTKYLNGHGDVIAGAVISSLENITRFKYHASAMICGSPTNPFTSYMILRGLKTLHLRLERHCQNAMALARFLETSEYVDRVFYPGLESHPQHETAKKQMRGGMYGGMLSFSLKEGIRGQTARQAVDTFLKNLTIPTLAPSLADADTLILHPATMSHRDVPAEAKRKAGITDGMLRVSVGLEYIEDIIADFRQALEKI